MTTAPAVRVTPGWLALREPADAAARSTELVARVRERLRGAATTGPLTVHDLGSGTGSMGRWLAPVLDGPQHWVLHDLDADLLAHAAARAPRRAADASAVSVETRVDDVTALTADDLAGASLVTTSALLDLLTADEVEHLATACVGAGCPALLTLSVAGRVELAPVDPLDADLAAAFDEHQRRTSGGRRLLGPDAPAATVEAFTRRGADVEVRESPWRLGRVHAALTGEWLAGWVGAAVEQRPDLAEPASAYLHRRRAEAADGRLRVTVHHLDLLALPR